MIFDDLLLLDRNRRLFEFKFKNSNIPLYLIYRAHLFKLIILNEIEVKSNVKTIKKKNRFSFVRYCYLSFIKNIFFAPKKPIYWFSSEILFIKSKGGYVNRIYNKFISGFKERIQLISYSSNRTYKSPTKENAHYQNLINDISILFGFFNPISVDDRLNINSFIASLKKNHLVSLTNDQFFNLEQSLIKTAKRKYFLTFFYNLFFKIKSPKLLILEDAHYMGEKAFIIEAAKKNGVKTAEFQHGYVGFSHYAYNFDSSIFLELKNFLPDYFLVFGKYWRSKVRTPSKKIVIGHPEIIEKYKSLKQFQRKKEKRNILVLSATFHQNELIALCKKLLAANFNVKFNLVIRPHPSERENFKSNFSEILRDGFQLDENIDLYHSLINTEIVISLDITTVLYESIFFTKKIFLMDTQYASFYETNHKFLSFSNYDQLIEAIEKEEKVDLTPDNIWDKDYLTNFTFFLNELNV